MNLLDKTRFRFLKLVSIGCCLISFLSVAEARAAEGKQYNISTSTRCMGYQIARERNPGEYKSPDERGYYKTSFVGGGTQASLRFKFEDGSSGTLVHNGRSFQTEVDVVSQTDSRVELVIQPRGWGCNFRVLAHPKYRSSAVNQSEIKTNRTPSKYKFRYQAVGGTCHPPLMLANKEDWFYPDEDGQFNLRLYGARQANLRFRLEKGASAYFREDGKSLKASVLLDTRSDGSGYVKIQPEGRRCGYKFEITPDVKTLPNSHTKGQAIIDAAATALLGSEKSTTEQTTKSVWDTGFSVEWYVEKSKELLKTEGEGRDLVKWCAGLKFGKQNIDGFSYPVFVDGVSTDLKIFKAGYRLSYGENYIGRRQSKRVSLEPERYLILKYPNASHECLIEYGTYRNYEFFSVLQDRLTTKEIETLTAISKDSDVLLVGFNGLSSEQRKLVQEALKNFDFYRSTIDGLYGPGTRKALEAYFKSKDISSDDVTAVTTALNDLVDEGENLAEITRKLSNTITVNEELIDQHSYEKYLLEDVGGFVSLQPGVLDPVELASLYIPAKREVEKQGLGGKNYEKLKAVVTGNQQFMDYHSEQIGKREAAVDSEIDTEFTFINSALDKLRAEVASDPLSERSMRLTAIIGQYSGIDRKRDAAAITELAEGLRTQLEKVEVQFDAKESELKPVPALTENTPLVELASLEPNDTALIVHFGPRAPHTYKDLDGTYAFSDYTANVCAPALAGSDKRYVQYLSEELEGIFPKPDLNVSTSCSDTLQGIDLIYVTGADVSNGLNLPPVLELGSAFKAGEISSHRVIKFADFQNKQLELKILSERLATEVSEGTRLGLGAVYSPADPSSLCVADIGEQEPGYDEVVSEVGNLSKLYLGTELSQPKYTDLRSAFRGLQKGDCGTVFGTSTSLTNLLNAANKSSLELNVLPVWFSQQAIEDRRAELEANKNAEVQRQQKSKEQLAFEIEQRRQKAEALAQQLETRQANSRAQYGLRVKGLVADIDKQIERVRSDIDVAYNTSSGLDTAIADNSFWGDFTDWYSDQRLKGWEFDRITSETEDYGTVKWNGRELEGVVSKLVVYMRNADLGQYSETCWLVGYKVDTEFDRLRDPLVVNCDAAASNVLWKTKSSFVSRWNFVK